MPALRFQTVFGSLLLLSAICAFGLAEPVGDTARAQLQGLFSPIAGPARMLASNISGRVRPKKLDPESPAQPRGVEAVYRENEQLRLLVARLTGQLDQFRERDARLTKLGPLRDLCISFSAVGGDVGSREMLNLGGSTFTGLKPGLTVLTEEGDLAGDVDRAGATGGTVRLLTDKGFRFMGTFARIATENGQARYLKVPTDALAVLGVGDNAMVVENLPWRQVTDAGVTVGDWVMLNDPDWPAAAQWTRAGLVRKIEPRPDAPGFAEITVTPAETLMQMRDVLVMKR